MAFDLGIGGGNSSSSASYDKSGFRNTMPIINDDWLGNYYNFLTGMMPPGMDGGNAQAQDLGWDAARGGQQAQGYLTSQIPGLSYGAGDAQRGMLGINDDLERTTQAMYREGFGGPKPQDVNTSAVNVGGVNIPGASSFMDQYTNPFNSQVKDATLQDIMRGGQVAATDLVAKYGGSGAYGGGGMGVALGELGSDVARQYGTAAANLNREGFNTALGAGQSDRNATLSAAQGNQSTDAAVKSANAARDMQAQMFNYSGMMDQNQFLQNIMGNVAGIQQNKLGNLNTINNVGQNAATAAAGGAGTQTDIATALSGMSQQDVDNILRALGMGTATHGEGVDYGERGTSKGSSSNFNFNAGVSGK